MRGAGISVLMMAGCVGGFPAAPGPTPAADGAMDAALVDGGRQLDLGRDVAVPDARPEDAAPKDAGPLDGAPVDATPRDAGPIDSSAPDATPRPDAGMVAEACNGVDDDLDGQVDEGRICGMFMAEACRLALARSPGRAGGRDAWDACLRDGSPSEGETRCAEAPPGRWTTLLLDPDLMAEGTARVGVALRCAPGPDGVGDWIQSHCLMFLGAGREPVPPGGQATWGLCPEQVGRSGDWTCNSTTGSGGFEALTVPARLGPADWFAVALRCDDPTDPLRAQAMSAAVSVGLGWASGERADLMDLLEAERWGPCPPAVLEWNDARRCNTTRGAGGFHAVPVGPAFGPAQALGLRLLARP